MNQLNNLAHYGDIMAIPFFIITLIYFYRIEYKTLVEYIIMTFIFICLIGYIIFTYIFIKSK